MKDRDIILQMQKCQRNWNYNKKIPSNIVDELLWVAKNSPSKQHEAYYDVYYTIDRKVIEELYQNSWGNTQTQFPPANARNSQMNANMFMLFVMKQPETIRNSNSDGTLVDTNSRGRWENGIVSVGIAMGLVMHTAIKHGLVTGCNKNNSHGPDCNFNWEKRLGIYEDVVIHKTKKFLYGIGIGYPQENRDRNESDDTKYCIGSSNGNNLTTGEIDVNPITNKTYRKVKIVDIKDDLPIQKDPYGNVHELPEIIKFRTHSNKDRNINCIEIK